MKHAHTGRSNANSKAQANMYTSWNHQCNPDMQCSNTWTMETSHDCKSDTKSIKGISNYYIYHHEAYDNKTVVGTVKQLQEQRISFRQKYYGSGLWSSVNRFLLPSPPSSLLSFQIINQLHFVCLSINP